MKPETYLTERGKQYFKILEKILKDNGNADDSFSIELSILANEYSKYEEATEIIKRDGYYIANNKTGWRQIAPQVNVQKDAIGNILKLSPKFGLTPLDRSKLPVKKEADKTDDLAEALGL